MIFIDVDPTSRSLFHLFVGSFTILSLPTSPCIKLRPLTFQTFKDLYYETPITEVKTSRGGQRQKLVAHWEKSWLDFPLRRQ